MKILRIFSYVVGNMDLLRTVTLEKIEGTSAAFFNSLFKSSLEKIRRSFSPMVGSMLVPGENELTYLRSLPAKSSCFASSLSAFEAV